MRLLVRNATWLLLAPSFGFTPQPKQPPANGVWWCGGVFVRCFPVFTPTGQWAL